MSHKRVAGAIGKEHCLSQSRPVAPALTGYDAKAVSAALYGAELWGFYYVNDICRSEHKFLRDLVMLPRNIPLTPLMLDMGRRPIGDIAKLRPLLFWARIRWTPKLSKYAKALNEVIHLEAGHRIRWISNIRKTLIDLGFQGYWDKQEPPSKEALKRKYWEWKDNQEFSKSHVGRLTEEFYLHKQIRRLEPYLDIIQVLSDRTLYIYFRFGTLPVRAVTAKWHPPKQTPEDCPCCRALLECVAHVLFVCPAYNVPRSKWLKPICRELGTHDHRVALRIFRSDPRTLFVCGVAKFLSHAWLIRRQALPGVA